MLVALAYLLPRHRIQAARPIQPDVAVVVPVRNRQESVRSLIEGILASDYPSALLRVVIVDTGSQDATVRRTEEVMRKSNRVFLVRIADPIGRGEMVKKGSGAYPQASIVVMLDPSVTLEAQAITNLVREFEDPWVAAVSGRVRSHPLHPLARFGWWRAWEHMMRRLEAAFDSAIGCNSLLYAVRRDVAGRLSESALAENFEIAHIAIGLGKGCRVADT
ncbi:MAG: glycosyltransferase, partial [Verrucomicrobiia bacterium]